MYKKVRGFTLIEILIVVFIITLLSAISIGYYTEQQKVSRDAQRKSDLIKISGALKNYFSVNKVYPLWSDHTVSSGNTVQNCFYFSYGGVTRIDAPNGDDDYCSILNTHEEAHSLPNNYYEHWIPNLTPNYLSNLPIDPKFKDMDSSGSFKDCTNGIISKNLPSSRPIHSTYKGCDDDFWAYFYTARLQLLESTSSTIFKPQKFYILGSPLENVDDRSTIGVTKQKIFNLPNTYNSDNPILTSINPTYTGGMPDNLYIVTSE